MINGNSIHLLFNFIITGFVQDYGDFRQYEL